MDRRRFPPAGVIVAAAGAATLLLATASRYGFHRDELYFVVAGRRLDWGFVDQPPLAPLLARISELVLGTSPFALRVFPALAVGGVALLAAAMARRFGGGTTAQVYAAFAAGWAGVVLGEGHLLSTAIFDLALWTLGLWIVTRILDGADPRWWLAFGVTVGVGLQNKHTIAIFAAAVVIGFLLTPQRSLLASRWPWAGAVLAGAIALPNVLWQAANGWPQLEMADALRARSDGAFAFVAFQPLLLSVALAVPAAVGLWRLLRNDDMAKWRPIGVTYVVLFVLFLTTGGKAYYIAPMYTALLAAGSLWFAGLGRRATQAMTAATVAGVAVGILIALPVVPPSSLSSVDATGELGETIGWPELVDQVAAVYQSIPPEERADVAIFTGSYGQAGAIDLLGPELGLPSAASGHNNYWLWGPPPPHGPVIGVGPLASLIASFCPQVEVVGEITNPHGVDNEENGNPLLLCMEPSRQLADVWDDMRHYN